MPTRRARFAGGVAIITEQDHWKPGDQPPADDSDYLGWHEWASVQHKAKLRQVECGRCGKWRYPQELSAIVDKHTASTRWGQRFTLESPVCNKCALSAQSRPEGKE